jgi:hypothetical protein
MDVIKWGKTRQIKFTVDGVTEAATETDGNDYVYDGYIYDDIVHAPVPSEYASEVNKEINDYDIVVYV